MRASAAPPPPWRAASGTPPARTPSCEGGPPPSPASRCPARSPPHRPRRLQCAAGCRDRGTCARLTEPLQRLGVVRHDLLQLLVDEPGVAAARDVLADRGSRHLLHRARLDLRLSTQRLGL